MARGRIRKRNDRSVYLDDTTRIQPRQHYRPGFSPILSEGDALDVKYSGTLQNPRNIQMTLPEKKAPYTFVPVVEKSDRSLLAEPRYSMTVEKPATPCIPA